MCEPRNNVFAEGHPCHNFIKALSVKAPAYVLKHDDVMAEVQECDRLAMKCNALNLALRQLEVENATLKLKLKRREVEDTETEMLVEEARRRKRNETSDTSLFELRKSQLEALELQFKLSEHRLAKTKQDFEEVEKWRAGLRERAKQQATSAESPGIFEGFLHNACTKAGGARELTSTTQQTTSAQ
jgi:Arc/MetJ family transcription regulator